jgi:hypothetical protein
MWELVVDQLAVKSERKIDEFGDEREKTLMIMTFPKVKEIRIRD